VSSAFEKEEEGNAENEKYHPRYHASNSFPKIRIGGASAGRGLSRISQYERYTYPGALLSWGISAFEDVGLIDVERLVVVFVCAAFPPVPVTSLVLFTVPIGSSAS